MAGEGKGRLAGMLAYVDVDGGEGILVYRYTGGRKAVVEDKYWR